MTTELQKGANAPVSIDNVKVTLTWSGPVDVDAAALLCTSTGQVRSDDDFIFYNQPHHRSDAVSHLGKVPGAVSVDSLGINLGLVESEIEKIMISGSVHSGTFGQLTSLSVSVVDAETSAAVLQFTIPGATVETAMIAGELYRRNGVWKFRAVGQGYSSGLRGVATDFGITVEDDDLGQADEQPDVYAPQPQTAPTQPAHVPPPVPYPPNGPSYQDPYGQPPPVRHDPYQQPGRTAPAQHDPYRQPPPQAPAYQPQPPPQYQPQQPVPMHQPQSPPQQQQQQYADMANDAPEEEVTLQPFPTNNPYLKKIFTMKEFGRAPGRALQVYRERVVDPDEKMIAAFKSKHGQYKWGYLVLTSHALRWFQTMPTRDEDLWGWEDVTLVGSVVRCEVWQYQLKGFGAGRKFKALMLVLGQSQGWENNHK